jgi:hypothetical protein
LPIPRWTCLARSAGSVDWSNPATLLDGFASFAGTVGFVKDWTGVPATEAGLELTIASSSVVHPLIQSVNAPAQRTSVPRGIRAANCFVNRLLMTTPKIQL